MAALPAGVSGAESLDLALQRQYVALCDLADAAAATASTDSSDKGGFLAPLTNTLELVLKNIQSGLDTLHVPYSYGFSIILLTVLVKTLTFPLTKKQVGMHGVRAARCGAGKGGGDERRPRLRAPRM